MPKARQAPKPGSDLLPGDLVQAHMLKNGAIFTTPVGEIGTRRLERPPRWYYYLHCVNLLMAGRFQRRG
jgi:hypothetical protein